MGLKNILEEFKAFAIKGNVMELAAAVVIGTAFGKITTSLVNNIIMPLFGVLIGGIDFTDKMFVVGKAEVTYGVFVQSILEFVFVAFALFILLKAVTMLKKKITPEEVVVEKPVEVPEDILLLREIRDNLAKR